MSSADLEAFRTVVIQDFLRNQGADEAEVLNATRAEPEDVRRARLAKALESVFNWEPGKSVQAVNPFVAKFGDWLSIESAPRDGTEVIVGRPDQPCEEDGAFVAGCVCVAVYKDGKWLNQVDSDLQSIFGTYTEIPGVTSWTPWPELPAADGPAIKSLPLPSVASP